jgi:hypothetical protein
MAGMSQTSFGLVEPFDVDDGSLASVSPAECFALGVEWQTFRQRLATGARFTELCLANNAVRLVAMAERQGRYVEHHQACEGWASVTVGGVK